MAGQVDGCVVGWMKGCEGGEMVAGTRLCPWFTVLP